MDVAIQRIGEVLNKMYGLGTEVPVYLERVGRSAPDPEDPFWGEEIAELLNAYYKTLIHRMANEGKPVAGSEVRELESAISMARKTPLYDRIAALELEAFSLEARGGDIGPLRQRINNLHEALLEECL
jgi:hypothetical protein